MSRRLVATVVVGAETWEAGSEPPADVAKEITNPDAWETPDAESGASEDEEPPRAGTGATTAAWQAYYEQVVGEPAPDDAGRDDLIALLDAR